MRKVILNVAISLDGFIEGPNGEYDWCFNDQDYGLVQVYGYRSTSRLFQTNTSIDTGQPLVPVAGAVYLQSISSLTTSSSDVTLQPVFAVLGESIVSSSASATVSRKIFLRAM